MVFTIFNYDNIAASYLFQYQIQILNIFIIRVRIIEKILIVYNYNKSYNT